MKIAIAIVEDDPEISGSLYYILSEHLGKESISKYSSGEQFISSLQTKQPDVVLMDIQLPGLNGIECVAKIKPQHPEIQFMIFSIYEDSDKLFEALCAGATGYLIKSSPPEKILAAIEEIHLGGSPMSPQIARKVVEKFSNKNSSPNAINLLTEREKEILTFLSKGLRYKEISSQLFLSVETVRKHVRNIYSKLQVSSRTEALNAVYGAPSRNINTL